MKKRLLCLLLMVTLLAGMMPAAFAEGNIVSYTVKSGDTMLTICEDAGLEYYSCRWCIMKLNGFYSESQLGRIYPGQTIKLPASVEVSAKIMSGELNLDGTVPEAKPAETPAPAEDKPAESGSGEANIIKHTVGEWDTLISICGSYGMNYYNVKSAIMKLNGFTSEKQLDVLSPGKVIKLPASEDDAKNVTSGSSVSGGSSAGGSASGSTGSGSGISYVVKAGDTFITICESHGLNFFAIKNQLMKLNGFKNASQLDSLRVGQTVKLPGSGSTPSTPGTPETPDKPSTPSTGGGTTTPAPSVDYKTISHTVGEWDTLVKVCGSYGMNFYTVKYAIMKLNGFTSERQLDILSNGQVIKLPASEDDAKLVMGASTTTTKPSGGSTGGASTGSGSATGESVAYYLIPYTFQPGDTVYNICLSMGVDFEKNSDLIKKLNSIKDYRSIADGKVLLIPCPKAPESGSYYKVVAHKLVSGETAESVTAGYGLDYSKVLNMMKLVNGKDSFEMIYAGTILYVPVSCKA